MSAWVSVPCDAADTAAVEIAVGRPDGWQHAFRDYDADGNRCAKIRLAEEVTGRVRIYLRVNGAVSEAGIISR